MCSQEEDLLRALLNPCDLRFLLSSDNDNSYEDANLLETGRPRPEVQSGYILTIHSVNAGKDEQRKISNRESRDSTPSRITTPDPGQALIQPTQGSSRE